MAVLDACVWVALFQEKDVFHSKVKTVFENLLSSGEEIRIPTIAFTEVAGSIARRSGSQIAASKALASICSLNPETWELDTTLEREATRIAIALGLKGADAVYVALACETADTLVTFDKEILSKAKEVVSCFDFKA